MCGMNAGVRTTMERARARSGRTSGRSTWFKVWSGCVQGVLVLGEGLVRVGCYNGGTNEMGCWVLDGLDGCFVGVGARKIGLCWVAVFTGSMPGKYLGHIWSWLLCINERGAGEIALFFFTDCL